MKYEIYLRYYGGGELKVGSHNFENAVRKADKCRAETHRDHYVLHVPTGQIVYDTGVEV